MCKKRLSDSEMAIIETLRHKKVLISKSGNVHCVLCDANLSKDLYHEDDCILSALDKYIQTHYGKPAYERN